jgi:hypothetical protein
VAKNVRQVFIARDDQIKPRDMSRKTPPDSPAMDRISPLARVHDRVVHIEEYFFGVLPEQPDFADFQQLPLQQDGIILSRGGVKLAAIDPPAGPNPNVQINSPLGQRLAQRLDAKAIGRLARIVGYDQHARHGGNDK